MTRPLRTRRVFGMSLDAFVVVPFMPMERMRVDHEAGAGGQTLRLETTEASHGRHG